MKQANHTWLDAVKYAPQLLTVADLEAMAALADSEGCSDELRDEIGVLETKIDSLTSELELYKQFFEDCFARLDGHYPCPNITSDYDKSVIFEAIEKGSE